MTGVLAFIGRNTLQLVRYLDGLYDLTEKSAYWTFVAPLKGRGLKWGGAVHQMVLAGVNSIPIVSLISLFIGIILALQGAYQLQKFGAVTAGAVLLSAIAVVQAASASAATAPPVTIGTVQGMFFTNPTPDSGIFDPSVLTGLPLFTQQFPVIGFNPPPSPQAICSNVTHVDIFSRPMGDVVPNPDGTCSVIPVAGKGFQAGLDPLSAFQAVFTADLNVSSAGQVTFNVFSDDGFVLAIGPQGTSQPARISGPMVNPPPGGISYVKGYPVAGAFNFSEASNANDITVSFAAAGTYPLELDYNECCGGQLSITLAASGTIVPPLPTPTTHANTSRNRPTGVEPAPDAKFLLQPSTRSRSPPP